MVGPQFSPRGAKAWPVLPCHDSFDGASKLRGSDHPYSESILDSPDPYGSIRLMSARAWAGVYACAPSVRQPRLS